MLALNGCKDRKTITTNQTIHSQITHSHSTHCLTTAAHGGKRRHATALTASRRAASAAMPPRTAGGAAGLQVLLRSFCGLGLHHFFFAPVRRACPQLVILCVWGWWGVAAVVALLVRGRFFLFFCGLPPQKKKKKEAPPPCCWCRSFCAWGVCFLFSFCLCLVRCSLSLPPPSRFASLLAPIAAIISALSLPPSAPASLLGQKTNSLFIFGGWLFVFAPPPSLVA